MKNNFALRFLLVFVGFFIFSGLVYSDDVHNNTTWVYDKTSDVDVFGKHDSNTINHLNEIYKKTIINVGEKKLTIDNEFLEDSHVCSIDYVKLKRTPLSYYLSQKTVDMYEQLFKHEGRKLPQEIYILTSMLPGYECPSPYTEIINAGNYFLVSEQNYILFFKNKIETSVAGGEIERKESWSTYCHNESAGHVYDGTSKSSCFFDGMDLKDAYNKLMIFSKISRDYLKEDLPTNNYYYKINGGVVHYKWDGNSSLKVLVIMDNETMSYSFYEKSSGTKLDVTGETQY
jgi:hypothetical protein